MESRLDRIARNESLFRASNREIERASQDAGDREESEIEVLCECGQEGCRELITVTISDYDKAHGQADRFIVVPGHDTPEIERVVELSERYLIVDKFGEAEEISEGGSS